LGECNLAMEKHALTTPITSGTTISDYQVRFLNLHWDGDRYVEVGWKDNTGKLYNHTYRNTATTPTLATDLLIALNKANLSIKSLHRRILERLAADGLLATGTITGSPD